MNILICDPISKKGIEYFQQQSGFHVEILEKPLPEEELLPRVGKVNALVVRSETKITRAVLDAAPELKVVGRAGVGVDNIDIDAATQKGVVVLNTPAGNTISTAELTFSMMMSLARKIPQANASIKAGEWNRKAFKGVELYNKTLGILGMGRIGSEVAKRAVAFGMKVLAYDPYLTEARAKALQVELIDKLEDIFPKVDFLTVHMPLSDQTKGMVDKSAFDQMKQGVQVINCARGGIIHEKDLYDAVKSGKVAGAALDVYETEPLPSDFFLRELPEIIMTPHLGASTGEAQENVGIEVAETITDYLCNGAVRNAINLPNMDAKTFAQIQPYLILGEKLGQFISQITSKRNDKLIITFGGKACELRSDPITRFVLKGFLKCVEGNSVNQINVRSLADSLGILVEEVKSNEQTDFNEWLHVAAYSGNEKQSVGGTFFGSHLNPRIVRINGQSLECDPSGVLLLMNNKDRPGIVGHIGNIMGQHNLNIANMSLSRSGLGGQALTVLNLDTAPSKEVLEQIQNDKDIFNVRVVKL